MGASDRRRHGSVALALFLLFGLAGFCNATAQASQVGPALRERQKVKVVVLSEIMTIVPFWLAYEKGAYQKSGLDVEVIQARSGSDAGRILISGSADIGILVAAHAMKALELGQPLRVVEQLTRNSTLDIITRADLNIRPGDWAALKGKKFGMTSAGSDTDLLLRAALAAHGIDPKKDVAIVATGGALEAMAAFKKKAIDGFLALPGMRGQLLHERVVNVFWSFQGDPILAGGPSIAVVTREAYRKDHMNVVTTFVSSTLAAVRDFYENPGEALKVASKVYKFPQEVLQLELDHFVEVQAFPPDGRQDEAAYEASLRLYSEAGLLKGNLPYDRVYTTEHLPKP